MADDQQAKQTTPKGAEIPVPTREDWLRNLKKIAPPAPQPGEHPDSQDP